MKHLYFVRHGESEANRQEIYAGRLDTPLTGRGREQAREAGARHESPKFDLILSSPLSRALETAQIIAEQTGYPAGSIVTNQLFLERNLGSLSGRSYHEVDEDDAQFTDMETIDQLVARAETALSLLRSLEAENVLLTSHGSFGRALQTVINKDRQYEDYDEPQNGVIIRFI